MYLLNIIGCNKSSQSSTEYCVKHGGGRTCLFDGCPKVEEEDDDDDVISNLNDKTSSLLSLLSYCHHHNHHFYYFY